ncbi:hypothetical protein DSO57_1005453 [Entomophthora muscae]|uniref:Uncharacterized protein n=1 Tax=Entomophthora muscae TaxID=34485 RepID=A0ACC2T8P6_9FUNG|nr:hypothetical protein DSO57_1005453 [Entomophthora muscae]
MVLTTGAASLSVTLFPCTFSDPSLFITEVPEPPKVSSHPLEEDITNSPTPPMVMVLLPVPLWAPLPGFSLDYKQAWLMRAPSSILVQCPCIPFLVSILVTLPRTCILSCWILPSPLVGFLVTSPQSVSWVIARDWLEGVVIS